MVWRGGPLSGLPKRLLKALTAHMKPAIHSVRLRPPAERRSIAALNPSSAWSLDMTPLVRGCSARSARNPATARLNSLMSPWVAD